jgi:DNA-directed RNA polymerase specialized sigma subunit
METNLINNLVWKFWNKNPDLEYEDMLSEALVAYYKALRDFDITKGNKKTTLIYTYVKNALITYIVKERQEKNHLSLITETGETMEIPVPWCPPISELLNDMGIEAREVCKIILESPLEYVGFLPKVCKGEIYKKLRKQGWSWSRIWKAFTNIKNALNEM